MLLTMTKVLIYRLRMINRPLKVDGLFWGMMYSVLQPLQVVTVYEMRNWQSSNFFLSQG